MTFENGRLLFRLFYVLETKSDWTSHLLVKPGIRSETDPIRSIESNCRLVQVLPGKKTVIVQHLDERKQLPTSKVLNREDKLSNAS